MIGTGAMCDPYMHCEDELRLTRRCLELIDRYEFGLAIQTKSNRILRDLDLLKGIHQKAKCVVQMTLTTYDESLCRILEPNACATGERFETLQILRDNGIPTLVWLAPILPFINDTRENIGGILDYCIRAGVHGILCFGMGVTLREGKLALYGSGARHTVKGGTGSGEVNSRYFVNVEQGLKEAGFQITTEKWLDGYDAIRVTAKKQFIKDVKARAREKHTCHNS